MEERWCGPVLLGPLLATFLLVSSRQLSLLHVPSATMSYRLGPPRALQHWAPFATSPAMKHSSRADLLALIELATHYLSVPLRTKPAVPEPLGSSPANKLASALYRLRLQTYEAQTALERLGARRHVSSADSEQVDVQSRSEGSDCERSSGHSQAYIHFQRRCLSCAAPINWKGGHSGRSRGSGGG